VSFDPDRPYSLHPQVALRRERFGALAYHYGNRRLTFLKAPTLVALVRSLAEHPSARSAVEIEIPDAARPAHLAALERLAASGMLCERPAGSDPAADR